MFMHAEHSATVTHPHPHHHPHLLVVDDDADVVGVVSRYFEGYGFRVTQAGSAAMMRVALGGDERIDAILLDLGLPDEDGLTVTRYIRERWKGALIIITGRAESVDCIIGLELGADDYLAKPFNLRELLARVRSSLRRALDTPPRDVGHAANVLCFSGFRLDTDTRELRNSQNQPVNLTAGEYELLRVLIANANRVISRDHLMNLIYGRDAGPYDRSIDAQIRRLRQKIEPDPAQPTLIKSVRSAGYLFTARIERS